ncbi:unnamed protein product [Allacma fusca]|uniref:Ig-like domain-containing protein n=1 Tax=Allacma fusca TaxID=39272 RepID=A0A8J2NQT4_9HEXA|nr:unnamed protein product [Allacma fusca]
MLSFDRGFFNGIEQNAQLWVWDPSDGEPVTATNCNSLRLSPNFLKLKEYDIEDTPPSLAFFLVVTAQLESNLSSKNMPRSGNPKWERLYERTNSSDTMKENLTMSLLAVLFWLGITGVEPLKNVQIIVPAAVTLGDNAQLQCLYDMDHNESLYAVKWYLDLEEFFRYVPKEVPPIQTFPTAGMNLDISKSDNHKVILKSVRHEQTGRYRCEVSADAPFFDTDVISAQMTVVEFPENIPLIEVAKHRYEVGERIRANCSFGPSRPAANITWFINDVQVKSQFITDYPSFEDGEQRIWAKSALEMDTDTNSFRMGRLKLKCTASVYSRFSKNSEVQIEEEKPRVLGSKDSLGKQVIGGLSNTPGHSKTGSVTQSLSSSSSTSSKASVQVVLVAPFALLFQYFLTILSTTLRRSSSGPSSAAPSILTSESHHFFSWWR